MHYIGGIGLEVEANEILGDMEGRGSLSSQSERDASILENSRRDAFNFPLAYFTSCSVFSYFTTDWI